MFYKSIKFCATIAFIFTALIAVESQADCVEPPSGLVSWWPGQNNPDDIVSTNHGTANGDTTYVPGKVGMAFSFDGTGDFVDVPDDSSLDITDNLTLDAWIKPTSFDIDTAGNPDLTDKNVYIVSKDSTAGRSYGIGMSVNEANNCGADFVRAFAIVFSGGGAHIVCGTTDLSVDNEYFIAGTYEKSSGDLKIYVNGSLENTLNVAAKPMINSTTSSVQIGARQYSGFRAYFNGYIDEVEIFNEALDDATIQSIYDAGADGKCKDDDNDGVVNDDDLCPNSDSQPDTMVLNPQHYGQKDLADEEFEMGPNEVNSHVYTMADTKGCTCTQIIGQLGLGQGQSMHGCSPGIMQRWTSKSHQPDRND